MHILCVRVYSCTIFYDINLFKQFYMNQRQPAAAATHNQNIAIFVVSQDSLILDFPSRNTSLACLHGFRCECWCFFFFRLLREYDVGYFTEVWLLFISLRVAVFLFYSFFFLLFFVLSSKALPICSP